MQLCFAQLVIPEQIFVFRPLEEGICIALNNGRCTPVDGSPRGSMISGQFREYRPNLRSSIRQHSWVKVLSWYEALHKGTMASVLHELRTMCDLGPHANGRSRGTPCIHGRHLRFWACAWTDPTKRQGLAKACKNVQVEGNIPHVFPSLLSAHPEAECRNRHRELHCGPGYRAQHTGSS
mmetsp:Transcript_104136/g.261947  ORF Transcript_104136/g.261947 Transcript_104136/m.261947 type:complete len:179 (-) Transcript_104136:31-567(-)